MAQRAEMPSRMWAYAALTHERYRRPVYPVEEFWTQLPPAISGSDGGAGLSDRRNVSHIGVSYVR